MTDATAIGTETMEEIDLEIGPGYDDATHFDPGATQNLALIAVNDHGMKPTPRKKKKVVKRWRDEWAETYKWAHVAVHEGSHRIFCSVCKEYGRKHRRNPYGNEGSRNMQMSALEEHNNSLLHKEALRLQMASRDKGLGFIERPLYVKDILRQCTNEGYFQQTLSSSILRRDPYEVEFIQSVQEVLHSLEPVLAKVPQYVHVLERLVEPERVVIFKVPWVDDKGEAHVNRGFRVQFNQALGPYKGGLRFHPTVNLSVVKFLAFEQTLKNSLSSLSLGGGKGGSDFNPKGKSENEIMRFCYSFMDELYRHIGPNQVPIFDTPSGDIGVGPREIGYLFGQYRRLTSQYEGMLGPKGIQWGLSNLHPEATGYGVVYFAKEVLANLEKDLKDLRCVVSGAGKVALYAVEKLIAFGAVPITISDTRGYLLDEDGFDRTKLGLIREIKAHNNSLGEYTKLYPRAKYFDDMKPWTVKCDIAFPCATQNELNHADAMSLINLGCQVIIEGANMPCTAEAIDVFRKSKVWFGPGKAANAGNYSRFGDGTKHILCSVDS
uniref:glutamate dehydrogenase (NADP(+)) n=1 Tax=Physcomitrium patens TaxID=3218 RepID=A0A7I4BUA7_PHYPA